LPLIKIENPKTSASATNAPPPPMAATSVFESPPEVFPDESIDVASSSESTAVSFTFDDSVGSAVGDCVSPAVGDCVGDSVGAPVVGFSVG